MNSKSDASRRDKGKGLKTKPPETHQAPIVDSKKSSTSTQHGVNMVDSKQTQLIDKPAQPDDRLDRKKGSHTATTDTKKGSQATDTKKSSQAIDTKYTSQVTDRKKSPQATDTKKGPQATDTKKGSQATDTKQSSQATDTKQSSQATDTKKDVAPILNSSMCDVMTGKAESYRNVTTDTSLDENDNASTQAVSYSSQGVSTDVKKVEVKLRRRDSGSSKVKPIQPDTNRKSVFQWIKSSFQPSHEGNKTKTESKSDSKSDSNTKSEFKQKSAGSDSTDSHNLVTALTVTFRNLEPAQNKEPVIVADRQPTITRCKEQRNRWSSYDMPRVGLQAIKELDIDTVDQPLSRSSRSMSAENLKVKDSCETADKSDQKLQTPSSIVTSRRNSSDILVNLRRKSAAIQKSMLQHKADLATLFRVPIDNYDIITQVACSNENEVDAKERLMSFFTEASRLTTYIDSTLLQPSGLVSRFYGGRTHTEERETMLSEADEDQGDDVERLENQLLDIITALRRQLSLLLDAVQSDEIASENLRKNLATTRRQITHLQGHHQGHPVLEGRVVQQVVNWSNTEQCNGDLDLSTTDLEHSTHDLIQSSFDFKHLKVKNDDSAIDLELSNSDLQHSASDPRLSVGIGVVIAVSKGDDMEHAACGTLQQSKHPADNMLEHSQEIPHVAVPSHNEDADRSHNEDIVRSHNEDVDLSHNENVDQSHNENVDPSHNEDADLSHNEDADRSHNEDADPSHNEDVDPSHNQDVNQSHNEDADQSHNEDVDRSHNQDVNLSHNEDADRSHNEDVDRSHNQDVNLSHNEDVDFTHASTDTNTDTQCDSTHASTDTNTDTHYTV